MNKKYFKITAANLADAKQLHWLLTNKTFYPESTSTPPLPGAFDGLFDYRQFFVIVEMLNDGSFVVFTRSEYTAITFGTNVIPTADWTNRYRMSIAPTITELPDYTEFYNGTNRKASIHSFLNYDYKLTNNI